MTVTALATTGPGDQPQWLSVVSEGIRGQILTMVARLPAEDQNALRLATRYVNTAHIAECQTADEVLELLKITAEAVMTDDQAQYIPAVYTINHKTQRFQNEQGDTLKPPFQAVIIYFQPTRGFFIEGRKLPLCSAIGTLVNGTAQKDAAEAWTAHNLFNSLPLNWAGATNNCATCPFNEFGSDPKTGAGKACKEKYRLFLALVDAQGNLTGEGVMMNVPTTSMKNWDTFVSGLKRHKNEQDRPEPLTTLHVVTQFELEKAQGQGQDYAKVLPKVARQLNAQEFRTVYGIRQQIVKVAEKLGVEVGEAYEEANALHTNPDPDDPNYQAPGPGF